MKSRILDLLRRHFVPNVGTVLAVVLLLFVYQSWAAPQDMAPASPVLAASTVALSGITPGTISYQGTLTSALGEPANGTVAMTFRLYSVPTGGSALWTEAHTGANAVPVSTGLFHVQLGSLTPISSEIWENEDLYLGITIGSDGEMSPREQVGDVPSSMVSGKMTGPTGYWADYRAYLRFIQEKGVAAVNLCPEGGIPVGVVAPAQSLKWKTGNEICQHNNYQSSSVTCLNVHKLAPCGSIIGDFYPYAGESCETDFSGSWAPFYWWDGEPSHDVTSNILGAGIGCYSLRYACCSE